MLIKSLNRRLRRLNLNQTSDLIDINTWRISCLQYQQNAIHLLIQLGFTEAQAKIYLTLIKTGETDAKTLVKESNISNQVTYRTLDELITKGIVEKKLSIPHKYQAIPIQDTVDLVLNAKAEEYTSVLEKTKQLLSQYNKENLVNEKNQDLFISIIEGKETIIKKTRLAHANALCNIIVCSTFQRWIQIDREINETIQNTLERGVIYRIVLEKPEGEMCLTDDIKKLIAKKNYQLKIINDKLKVNTTLFDEKMCSFSLYPTKNIAESPMIWTNHSSIIAAFQEYFEKTWKTTKKYANNKNATTKLTFNYDNQQINSVQGSL